MRKALEWLGGSVLVYVLLAACAGANGGGHQAAAGSGSEPEEVGAGGVPATPGAGGKDAATAGVGGILDPVPPAMAASGAGGSAPTLPELTVLTQPCTDHIKIGGSNQPAAVFVIDQSAAALSRAAAVVNTAGSDVLTAEGFTGRTQFTYVKDGAVGVVCGNATETVTLSF